MLYLTSSRQDSREWLKHPNKNEKLASEKWIKEWGSEFYGPINTEEEKQDILAYTKRQTPASPYTETTRSPFAPTKAPIHEQSTAIVVISVVIAVVVVAVMFVGIVWFVYRDTKEDFKRNEQQVESEMAENPEEDSDGVQIEIENTETEGFDSTLCESTTSEVKLDVSEQSHL